MNKKGNYLYGTYRLERREEYNRAKEEERSISEAETNRKISIRIRFDSIHSIFDSIRFDLLLKIPNSIRFDSTDPLLVSIRFDSIQFDSYTIEARVLPGLGPTQKCF
jgi:hypothetical protein